MTQGVPQLTEEQCRVAKAPPSQKTLVTAGPGTGKTHTVIARLAELTESYGLSPGNEILVLSFSRSAVHEIRRRARIAAGDTRYIRATTFDSYATGLLAQLVPAGPWQQESYEGRIVAATQAVRELDEAGDMLEDISHVILDEIQDLVGVREEFVKAILERVNAGFTIFGDPAQGIYNFQLQDPCQRAEGSAAFYRWLRKRYEDSLTEVTFTKNHRAATATARRALFLGPKISNAALDGYRDLWDSTQDVILDLRTLGNFEGQTLKLLGRTPGKTGVLCRTNGQALMCSRRLWDAGVEHLYSRGALDKAVPHLLGLLFVEYQYETITKKRFFELVGETLGPAHEPGELWTMTKRLDPNAEPNLSLSRVSERIRLGSVPDDLLERPDGRLVVSTIHRAKGLEFDTVVLPIGPNVDPPDDIAALAEEVRVRYVALTRPIKNLLRTEIPKFRGVYKHERSDRWVRRFNGWRAVDFEVVPDDVHKLDPAGAWMLKGVDPIETQQYMAEHVQPGDGLDLRLVDYDVGGGPRAFYAVEHAGTTVGVTTEYFAQKLHSFLKVHGGWDVKWPKGIGSLRVDGIDTVAGLASTGKKHGLGATGIWLRTRASGFGSLHF